MKRSDIERYERESVMRALGNHRGPGDDGAQQLLRSSERRQFINEISLLKIEGGKLAQPSGQKVKQRA
ncbi:hypothetical protein LMA04_17735 [Pseudescherichia vulneris]|uniref:hypothetical protein n=1 Tax=Pseudescherichia vulneris TaxID=566 RepID=UPI00227D315B|nr:hypothetical protein [Pseudescherichia vulneris]WAH51915.1 hypothetical protein LMA04_17735 [Pseudescherichia vulneris]